MRGISKFFAFSLALFWASISFAQSNTKLARVGVLAHRGPEVAIQHWLPLSEHLSSAVDGWRFVILPVTLVSAAEKIASKEIDFLITNPGHFISLSKEFSLSAIATREPLMEARKPGLLSYGTVILVRQDSGIRTISELHGKTMAAVSPDAFGGFQIAWNEMMQQGFDPFSDTSELRFMGFPQDAIVAAVADKRVDSGVVRSGLLERLEADGRINPQHFEILNNRSQPGYPYRVTGRLFPEWPFVVMPGVSKDLKEAVVIALLGTQQLSVQKESGLDDAWSTPMSYDSVRELTQRYTELSRRPVGERLWLIYVALAIFFSLGLSIYAIRLRTPRTVQPEAPATTLPTEDPRVAGERVRFESLTPREREILSLICAGHPSKKIATELGVSLKTIEFHRSNLLKKTDAGSTAHLVQLATRLGFDLGFSLAEIPN